MEVKIHQNASYFRRIFGYDFITITNKESNKLTLIEFWEQGHNMNKNTEDYRRYRMGVIFQVHYVWKDGSYRIFKDLKMGLGKDVACNEEEAIKVVKNLLDPIFAKSVVFYTIEEAIMKINICINEAGTVEEIKEIMSHIPECEMKQIEKKFHS